jgi:NAD-dependent SIR2 family protein deacetylase
VDSGLPDFRGNQGFWNAYPPLARRGLSFVEMANPSWFDRDPAVAWGFYGHRLNLYRATVPHQGFEILRRWGTADGRELFVFTSNVDGQFQRAGFDPDRIVECHGSIHHLQCTVPCGDDIWSADGVDVEVDEPTLQAIEPWPECPACGRRARPNVLMFGDWAWLAHRSSAQHHRLRSWLSRVSNHGLVVVEIGAGTAVPTVRSMSEQTTHGQTGTLVRINTREASAPPGQISISVPALEALEQIDAVL